MQSNPIRIAVIGGGISGATFFNHLLSLSDIVYTDIFDQGRSPGGRTSTRFVDDNLQFDHGKLNLDKNNHFQASYNY